MRLAELWKLLASVSLLAGALVIFVTNNEFLNYSKPSKENCTSSAHIGSQEISNTRPPLSSLEATTPLQTATESRHTARVFVLLLIISAPYNSERRAVIRRTWLSTLTNRSIRQIQRNIHAVRDPVNSTNQLLVYYEFVCGHYNDVYHKVDSALANESKTYEDILRLDYQETYAKLVKKTLAALTFAATIDTQYVVKMDDDVYLNVPRFVWWLQTADLPEKLYGGQCFRRSLIIRNKHSKYYLSFEHLNGTYFPPYCNGPFYLLSGNVLPDLLKASKVIEPFSVEDAYIGVLANRIGLKPVQLKRRGIYLESKLNPVVNWNDARLNEHFVVGHNLPIERLVTLHQRYRKLTTNYV